MRKKFLFLLLVVPLLLSTACSNNKEDENKIATPTDKYEGKSGSATCVLETSTQNLDFKGTYNFNYEDGKIVSTYTREVINLKENSTADSYEKKLREEFSKYDGIEYYEYEINKTDSKVTSTTSVDYKNVDLELLSEKSDQELNDSSLKFSKVLASYKIMGAKCEVE